MARTPKEFADELVSWPENGGFQYERLFEILADFEARIEALEPRRWCADCCGLFGGGPACQNCGSQKVQPLT